MFGLTDWTRDGTLAEYVAVEARNLAPLPGDVDFTVGAALVADCAFAGRAHVSCSVAISRYRRPAYTGSGTNYS